MLDNNFQSCIRWLLSRLCLLCVRVIFEKPIQPGSRGHGHDEGPVHESVGWPGHLCNHPGNTHSFFSGCEVPITINPFVPEQAVICDIVGDGDGSYKQAAGRGSSNPA